MRKWLWIFGVLLAACDSGSDKAGTPAADPSATTSYFEDFKSRPQVDCAGLRESYTVASGIGLQIRLNEDGSFVALVKEVLKEMREVKGLWTVRGEQLHLDNLGVGVPDIFDGQRLIKFDIDGWVVLLSAQRQNNPSGMEQCSPQDHSRMENRNGEILIEGQSAEEFWPERLLLGQTAKLVADLGDVRHTLHMREDQTYTYTQSIGFQIQAEVQGQWFYKEGLVVLENLGVITPYADTANGYLLPRLYFQHDPVNGVEIQTQRPNVWLNGRGV